MREEVDCAVGLEEKLLQEPKFRLGPLFEGRSFPLLFRHGPMVFLDRISGVSEADLVPPTGSQRLRLLRSGPGCLFLA